MTMRGRVGDSIGV